MGVRSAFLTKFAVAGKYLQSNRCSSICPHIQKSFVTAPHSTVRVARSLSKTIKRTMVTQNSASNEDDIASQVGIPPKVIKNMKRKAKASKGELSNIGILTPQIQWYPGHIAKAERQLKEKLKLVDVVIEVRDSRIPLATAHPEVPKWTVGKGRVLAMGRMDLIPAVARKVWAQYLKNQGEVPMFINAKSGKGVPELLRYALMVGKGVNEKRQSKGLLPRAVRCVVIGYPNVGKSALINRLVGKRAVKSANLPGVTRNLQWVKIHPKIDLLDMPGIIPAKMVSEDTGYKLAICDDIGQASYDKQNVAARAIEEARSVAKKYDGFFDVKRFEERYKVSMDSGSGHEILLSITNSVYQKSVEKTAVMILRDLRDGTLGPIALEAPPGVGIEVDDCLGGAPTADADVFETKPQEPPRPWANAEKDTERYPKKRTKKTLKALVEEQEGEQEVGQEQKQGDEDWGGDGEEEDKEGKKRVELGKTSSILNK